MATQEKKEVRVGSIVSCAYLPRQTAPLGIVLSIDHTPQECASPRDSRIAVVKWFTRPKHAHWFLYELRLIKQ